MLDPAALQPAPRNGQRLKNAQGSFHSGCISNFSATVKDAPSRVPRRVNPCLRVDRLRFQFVTGTCTILGVLQMGHEKILQWGELRNIYVMYIYESETLNEDLLANALISRSCMLTTDFLCDRLIKFFHFRDILPPPKPPARCIFDLILLAVLSELKVMGDIMIKNELTAKE
jgi:hypothetical protein